MSYVLPPPVQVTYTTIPNAVGVSCTTPPALQALDAINGGRFQVVGTVKITPDSPTHRKVTLFDATSRLLIREMWSDPATGAYAFTGIRSGTFIVISVDYTGSFRAVIADGIVSEPMP